MNRLMRKILLLGIAFILAGTPQAGACAEKSREGDEALRATLKNGLRVTIVRSRLAPVVTTMINYLVGSDEAPAGFPGTAHAQEHMMFRGSPGLSANQLADIIGVMGGMFDADTQQTVTQYFLTVPSQDLDTALHIEAIRMRGVLDTERLWARERGAIEQEVAQDLSDPEYLFYTRLMAHMFKGTPYARSPLGTVSSFNKTTGPVLKKFYETWYAPNNAILVIVGDVDPQGALGEVRKYFEEIPAKKIPGRPPVRLHSVKSETFSLKTDQSYGLAVVSFRMPGYGSEDYAASRVLEEVLSNPRSNLFALVPEGKALYSGFSLSTLPEAGLGYAIAAFAAGADSQLLVKEIRRILAEDVRRGFSPDLVEAAKRNKITKAELRKNSVMGLAMAWSQALAVEGRQSPDEEVRAIQKVAVADVNRVARKYLDLEHTIVAVLTPEVSGKSAPAQPRKAVESFAPKQARAVKLPDWAEKSVKRVSLPSSSVNPVVTVLPNGLKLIVQPQSVSDTVSVYGHIRNQPDLEEPKGKEGIDDVLGQLFSYGTRSLDRVAFQKALDDIGAQESAGTDFSLQVLTGDFEKGVQLLAENQLRPALPEEAFKIVQKQSAAAVAGQLKSPDYLRDRALLSALFPAGDPSLRQATPATISSITIQDVRDYYRKVYRPDLTTVVAIGNITPEKAKEVIEKHFGSWKAEGSPPETLLPPVPPNKPRATHVSNKTRVQEKVTLAETVGLTRSNPDYYGLNLGNHVLGGAFYASRLYRYLREEAGLVYYVSSSFEIGRTRGIYKLAYDCDPENVSKVRNIAVGILGDMQTRPVTPEELQLAKALLLREIPLSESSVDSIAGGLIYRSIHDLPLDEPILAAKRYLELNAEEIRALFAKWLRPKDLVQVTEGPISR